VVAVADHHADFARALTALRIAGVIDDAQNWIGGSTILVQTGDILDRGAGERDIIDFYEALRPQARAAGGAIINMLGNHEIMNAMADFRYVDGAACASFGDLIDEVDITHPLVPWFWRQDCKVRAAALLPGGPYAQIMADWPVVTIVGDTVFAHGGLNQRHVDFGIGNINRMTRALLAGEPVELEPGLIHATDEAVVWDRTYGYSPNEAECTALKQTLAQLGVKRLVVGHTIQSEGINSACDGAVWRIDVGNSEYYAARGAGGAAALQITDGEITVLTDPAAEDSP
jgi:hypothetical protein